MKSMLSSLALGLLLITNLSGQEIVDDYLVITGIWETTVPADYATIKLEVEGFGATLAEAIQSARFNVDAMTARLERFGFRDEHLTLSQFVSGENYFGGSFFTSKRDYRTKMGIQVTVEELRQLDSVLIALHDQDITTISAIEFSLDNPDTHKETALAKALAQAQAKAKVFVETLGITQGTLHRAEEVVEPQPMRVAFAAERGAQMQQTLSVLSNQIPIKGEVKLIYRIHETSQ